MFMGGGMGGGRGGGMRGGGGGGRGGRGRVRFFSLHQVSILQLNSGPIGTDIRMGNF